MLLWCSGVVSVFSFELSSPTNSCLVLLCVVPVLPSCDIDSWLWILFDIFCL